MARILVADDEEVILALIQRVLKTAGHEVVTAIDGEEALKLAISQTFDLYIVDVRMPRLDGYTFSKDMTTRFPGRKVILMSGQDSEKNEAMMKASGAVCCIAKPFEGPQFLSEIAKFI